MPELTDADREMLAIERAWWAFPGAKEQAIRDRLGMSATEFYQRLNALIETEAALAFDPLTTNRLRRLRDARKRSRV